MKKLNRETLNTKQNADETKKKIKKLNDDKANTESIDYKGDDIFSITESIESILKENSVVLSNSSGSILVENMSSQELDQIEDLNEETGDYEDIDIVSGSDDNIIEETDETYSDSNDENIIRLQFEDSFGNLKEIIIKYK